MSACYEVLNASVGTCKVTVNTEAVKRDISALTQVDTKSTRPNFRQPEGSPLKYMPIDPKYGNLKTTPIEMTVEKGVQTRDVELP